MTPRCRPGDTQACVVRAGHKSACLLALLPACLAFAGPARAEVASEFWPEIGVFVQLNDRSRACFDAAHARGKESDVQSLDVAACLDIALKPIARPELLSKDWQRSKYLWARIGYDRIFETTDSTETEVAEDRGVIAIYGRAPLPASIWLEARTRADFRWIGDEYSNRYRFRVDATREFTVLDHTVVPHFNYEWIYDTRYDDWARTLWTLGAEVVASSHRFETADEAPASRMAGYALANLTASWAFARHWQADLRWNNVTDKDYEQVQGYRTPGSNVFLSVRWTPA